MILYKRLAVTVLRRKNFAVSRKNVIALNNLCLPKYSITCRQEFPVVQNATRTFCTRSNSVTEDPAEDLSGELEEEITENIPEALSTQELFEEIANGDDEILRKLKLLEFEVAILREEESRVPDELTKHHWEDLLTLPTASKRRKFLRFLRLNELKALSSKERAKSKRDLWQRIKTQQGFHYYGLSGHTMFLRVYDRVINRYLITRTLQSKLTFLIDCSYQEYMSLINLKSCAVQISYCFTESRNHMYPAQVKLCNLDKNDALGKLLPRFIHGIYENKFDEIHSESFLDLYPREKLVYLTPHTKIDLGEFNHDDVYIIGGFVDKGTGEKASLAKAKENKVRMARLPLDDYLIWKQGTKSLPLNIVLTTMLDMAYYGDWKKALKNIPRRCVSDEY